jgi:hypothetical protein
MEMALYWIVDARSFIDRVPSKMRPTHPVPIAPTDIFTFQLFTQNILDRFASQRPQQ